MTKIRIKYADGGSFFADATMLVLYGGQPNQLVYVPEGESFDVNDGCGWKKCTRIPVAPQVVELSFVDTGDRASKVALAVARTVAREYGPDYIGTVTLNGEPVVV